MRGAPRLLIDEGDAAALAPHPHLERGGGGVVPTDSQASVDLGAHHIGGGTGAASHHPRRADADSNAADGMVELASSLARKENPMAGKVRRPRPKRLALSSLHTCPIDS